MIEGGQPGAEGMLAAELAYIDWLRADLKRAIADQDGGACQALREALETFGRYAAVAARVAAGEGWVGEADGLIHVDPAKGWRWSEVAFRADTVEWCGKLASAIGPRCPDTWDLMKELKTLRSRWLKGQLWLHVNPKGPSHAKPLALIDSIEERATFLWNEIELLNPTLLIGFSWLPAAAYEVGA